MGWTTVGCLAVRTVALLHRTVLHLVLWSPHRCLRSPRAVRVGLGEAALPLTLLPLLLLALLFGPLSLLPLLLLLLGRGILRTNMESFSMKGIGGDYPLSAVITSEYATVKTRGRMIAAVFAMQVILPFFPSSSFFRSRFRHIV